MLEYSNLSPEYNPYTGPYGNIWERTFPAKFVYSVNVTVDDVLWEYKNVLTDVMEATKEKLKNIDPALSIELNITPLEKFFIPIEFKEKFEKASAFDWIEDLEKNYIRNNGTNRFVKFVYHVADIIKNKRKTGRHSLHLYFVDNYKFLNSVGGFTIKNHNKESSKLYKHISTVVFERDKDIGKQSMVKAILHEILHTLGAIDLNEGPDDIMFGYQLKDRNVNLSLSQRSVQMILKKYWLENEYLYGADILNYKKNFDQN